jgi:hypothetical protein
MRSHTSAFKRISCDLCKKKDLSPIAKLNEDEYAMTVPPNWRLVWDKAEKELKFLCGECWETVEMALESDDRVV